MLTRLRKALYRVAGQYPGTLGGVPFLLDPYHSKFWRKTWAGTWEPETFKVLDTYLDPSRGYIDIGAWIGPTVLYAARKSRHVWCFEPDPTAFRHLAWNLELNNIRNVSAFCAAVSTEFGVARMASIRGEAGDSTTSLLNDGAHGTDALTIAWDAFAKNTELSDVALVKMDIEGGEFAVLPGLIPWLSDVRPVLYLSTHAPYLPETDRRDAMEQLGAALSDIYTIEDRTGAEVGADGFTSDDALNKFRSFVCRPK